MFQFWDYKHRTLPYLLLLSLFQRFTLQMVDNAYPFLFSFCCVFVCCLVTIQIYKRFSKFQTFFGKFFLCLKILGKVRWGACVRADNNVENFFKKIFREGKREEEFCKRKRIILRID